jgi:hypothetical protein
MMLQEVTTLGFFRAELVWRAWHVAESLLWGVILLLVVLAPLRMRPLTPDLGSAGSQGWPHADRRNRATRGAFNRFVGRHGSTSRLGFERDDSTQRSHPLLQ